MPKRLSGKLLRTITFKIRVYFLDKSRIFTATKMGDLRSEFEILPGIIHSCGKVKKLFLYGGVCFATLAREKKLIDIGVADGFQRIMRFFFWTVYIRLRSDKDIGCLRELILVNQLVSNVDMQACGCKSNCARYYDYGFYCAVRKCTAYRTGFYNVAVIS
jgi:hypothetical protein